MRLLAFAIALGVSTASAAQVTAFASGSWRVFFDWGKPDINRDAEAALEEVAKAYAQAKPSRISIIGHGDLSGPPSVNLRSSRQRAEAVRDFLAAHGVPRAIMAVEPMGEARPIVPTEDGVREGQNRRVEIAFLSSSAASALGARSAMVIRGDGSRAGAVSLTENSAGAWISIDIGGLPPGVHGMHLHAVGRCDAPDFASAGPHWNPTSRQHGLENPQGHHSGDLPNATIGPDGRLFAVLAVPRGIGDADGAALVIHAGPDDNRTDPSGNSGGRIACAVLAEPGGA